MLTKKNTAYLIAILYVVVFSFSNLSLAKVKNNVTPTMLTFATDIKTAYDIKLTSSDEDMSIGYTYNSAGDFNNDGFDDMAIVKNDSKNNFKIYIMCGNEEFSKELDVETDGTFCAMIYGVNENNISGFVTVASAGDTNNDGFDDLLIGDYGNNNGTGTAYLVYGRGDGSDTWINFQQDEYDVKFIGETENQYLGYAVSGAGDMNNDGYDDFLIGAPTDSSIGVQNGAVYLIYGQSKFSDKIINVKNANVKFFSQYKYTLAGLSLSYGDINNDGYDDILIGGAYYQSNMYGPGVSYALFGSKKYNIYKNSPTKINLDTKANIKLIGESENADGAGRSVSVGDVNNDGYDDILIGASEYNNRSGAVYLVYGSSSNSRVINLKDADAKFINNLEGEQVGWSVKASNDINNDGYNDILISTSSQNNAEYLMYGDLFEKGTLFNLEYADIKYETQDEALQELSYMGDINNDQYDDFCMAIVNDSESNTDVIYCVYGAERE